MTPARGSYVLTFGETMALMRSTETGPLAHTSTLSLGVGGSESNVAVGLSRLGVPAVWCGRVGNDSLGLLVEREIRAEGIDARIAVDPAAPTGLMIKERRTPSTQRVSYYRARSAGSRITPDDVDYRLIAEAGLLHISGITPALSDQAEATLRYAVNAARAEGVPVSFDLNYRANLWPREAAKSVYLDIIALSDIVFAGDDEAAIAVGNASSPEELAGRITAHGPTQAVIKLGAEGALAMVDGEIFRQQATPVNAVDTVGAGDAFVAGYLAELMAGLGVKDRLATAAATGAFACLVPGDWEGFPRRSELKLLGAKEPVSR